MLKNLAALTFGAMCGGFVAALFCELFKNVWARGIMTIIFCAGLAILAFYD
jgi:fructose-specific phosphotransferase system IIC component